MAALCRRYGLQRRIGYKWVERYQQNGRAGLEDLPRAPLSHPNRSRPATVERILAIRHEHPLWGALKIRALLEDQESGRKPPAASTIGEILRHEGLTRRAKKRRRTPPYEEPLGACRGSERRRFDRFQGVVSSAQRRAHRSADVDRQLQPLRAVLPSVGGMRFRACASGDGAGVRCLRAAEADTQRQRSAVCEPGDRGIESAEHLVGEVGDRGGGGYRRGGRARTDAKSDFIGR